MHQALVILLLLAQKMLLTNLILPNDIGSLFKPSVSTTDVVSIVNSLNQDQKIIC